MSCVNGCVAVGSLNRRVVKVVASRVLAVSLCVCSGVCALGQARGLEREVRAERLSPLLVGRQLNTGRSFVVRSVVSEGDRLRVRLGDGARLLPLTREELLAAADSVRRWTDKPDAAVQFYTGEVDLLAQAPSDTTWCHTTPQGSPVRRLDGLHRGPLTARNIALWPSHGRYYEPQLKRWEWQRGRLFTTVEDLLTPSIVLPFLLPMLENAGAYVLMPRERDTTRVACIVDVDDGPEAFRATTQAVDHLKGYAKRDVLDGPENPFALGHALGFRLTTADTLSFMGRTAATGPQTIYLAWAAHKNQTDSLLVAVHHAGGVARFRVNPRQGAAMWMPLATLPFDKNRPWRVDITGEGYATADAVRIGGGMGRVTRHGLGSDMPAWAEAARYYLQTDGFDFREVVSLSAGVNDYTDDVNCRGEWVNALVRGKGIPIDAALALHTDAGTTHTDSVIGTLVIVSTTKGRQTTLLDGRGRVESRYLGVGMERQIGRDLRRSWQPDWVLRGIQDKSYSESRRPEVPCCLIELLSHQNPAEVGLALHPAFRHDAARAIYKGLLRYLAGPDAPVEPLTPSHLAIAFTQAPDSLRLSWRPTADPLEPSAVANIFELYEGNRLLLTTPDTAVTVRQPQDGLVHLYRVVAVGPGGRSLPTASLPACLWLGAQRALLVDGMDRLAPPRLVNTLSWSGIQYSQEPGVPWDADVYTTGEQHDFDPQHPWLDDDAPGCGASYADREMTPMPGYPTHRPSPTARLLRQAGFSFVAQSKSAFDDDTAATVADTLYKLVRVDLQRQRATPYGRMPWRHDIYTPGFCQRLTQLAQQGVRLVVSGNYVASDLRDKATQRWAAQTLGFKPRTAHASRTLLLDVDRKWLADNCLPPPNTAIWHLNVDALEPADKTAQTKARYHDSKMSAAVERGNIIVCGF